MQNHCFCPGIAVISYSFSFQLELTMFKNTASAFSFWLFPKFLSFFWLAFFFGWLSVFHWDVRYGLVGLLTKIINNCYCSYSRETSFIYFGCVVMVKSFCNFISVMRLQLHVSLIYGLQAVSRSQ